MIEQIPKHAKRDLDRTLALSALFQVANLVHQVTQDIPLQLDSVEASLRSVFILDPDTIEDIFPERHSLEEGFALLDSAFRRPESEAEQYHSRQIDYSSGRDATVRQQHHFPALGVNYTRQAIRYVLALLYLDQKLGKNSELLSVIRSRLVQLRKQLCLSSSIGEIEDSQYTAATTIESLSDIYLDTAAKHPYRIQVFGKTSALNKPENTAKIRALLLSGLRAAMLWRQLGGRRWQLIFKRKLIMECVNQLQ